MMTIKEKLTYYLENKGETKTNFYNNIGVSNSFLASGKSIGSEKLIKIRNSYPDLNINWLLFDEGEMIISNKATIAEESAMRYESDSALSESLKKFGADIIFKEIAYLKEKIEILENNLGKNILETDDIKEVLKQLKTKHR